jgi:hypothetical protein
LFVILNFGLCKLPFDMAQGGELVEPFGLCDLLFKIFLLLKPEHRHLKPYVPNNMLSDKGP